MTIQELYAAMGGDYDRAIQIMRRDRLVDRTVRRFASSTLCADLMAAGETLESEAMFEAAHALKGVAANLGLTELFALTEVISDEFRPGNPRTLTDDAVRAELDKIDALCQHIVAAINAYVAEQDGAA